MPYCHCCNIEVEAGGPCKFDAPFNCCLIEDQRRDPGAVYDDASRHLITQLDNFIAGQFGKRHDPTDEDCSTCKLWALRDQIEKVVAT